MGLAPSVRHLEPPFTRDQLAPLEAHVKKVQFQLPYSDEVSWPTEDDHRRLGNLLQGRPDVTLRIFGHMATDLTFLRHFPGLGGFECDLFELQSLDGLELVAGSLRRFGFSQTRKSFAVDFLASMPQLEALMLEGHPKGFPTVARLERLRELRLIAMTLADLEPIANLEHLWWLGIFGGGTKSLEVLRHMKRVKHLSVYRILGLDKLDPVSDMTGLQYLFLQDLARVSRLPDLDQLANLRRLHLDGLKALTSLAPVLAAPVLEDLAVVNAPQLRIEDFLPLKRHATLKRLLVWTRSVRRDAAIAQALGLPDYGGQLEDDTFEYR